jgi:hypothetical protein
MRRSPCPTRRASRTVQVIRTLLNCDYSGRKRFTERFRGGHRSSDGPRGTTNEALGWLIGVFRCLRRSARRPRRTSVLPHSTPPCTRGVVPREADLNCVLLNGALAECDQTGNSSDERTCRSETDNLM